MDNRYNPYGRLYLLAEMESDWDNHSRILNRLIEIGALKPDCYKTQSLITIANQVGVLKKIKAQLDKNKELGNA